jgi:uncharacterized membrane protein YvbJ
MMPFCAKCGTKLEDAAGFCPKCGTAAQKPAADIGDTITASLKAAGRELEKALKTAGEEIDRAVREVKADLSDQEGPFCPKCGKRNPVDARFCVACGGEIPRVG